MGRQKHTLPNFKIINEPTCPCGTKESTTDHIIYECGKLKIQREKLKKTALIN